MTGLEIKRLDEGSSAAWDVYVLAHPRGTFFHRAAWRAVLERAFCHESYYLYAARDGRVVGVLPLGHIRSRLFGHSLVSVPFCVYGGTLADDAEADAALEAEALNLGRRLRVGCVEFRYREPRASEHPGSELYATFRKPICDSAGQLLPAPRKRRAVIRKGESAGLKLATNPDVGQFFRAYAESVRNLGTPVFPRRYFEVLADVFADTLDLTVIERGGKVQAAVLSFYFRDEVLPYYGGATTEGKHCAASDFMYWQLMVQAAARGARVFDFGRSKYGTGAFAYKTHWGFEPEPLGYRYALIEAAEPPQINPLNPKYRALIAVWRRLPLFVANRVGPWVSGSLG